MTTHTPTMRASKASQTSLTKNTSTRQTSPPADAHEERRSLSEPELKQYLDEESGEGRKILLRDLFLKEIQSKRYAGDLKDMYDDM